MGIAKEWARSLFCKHSSKDRTNHTIILPVVLTRNSLFAFHVRCGTDELMHNLWLKVGAVYVDMQVQGVFH